MVDADGGTPLRLANTPAEREASPSWSPDGSKIAFSAWDSDVTSGFGHAIYTMLAIGGTPTNITDGLDIGNVEGLDWQPPPEPSVPASRAECKKGGYRVFGFKKQGRCIAFVNKAAHDR